MKRSGPLLIIILASLLVVTGCTGTPDSKTLPVSSVENAVTVTSLEMTLEELKVFNGKEGQPAYVAVDGIVYDVSDIPEWQDGIHQGKFEAGNDLSEEIKQSPHGKSFLKKAKEIGILK